MMDGGLMAILSVYKPPTVDLKSVAFLSKGEWDG